MSSSLTKEILLGYTQREGECLIYTRCIGTGGYGHIQFEGRVQVAHRVSWKLHFGGVPQGIKVLHKCDNPACINPNHLFLGTQKDNVQDMFNKGRHNKRHGINNGNAFLTPKEVEGIRSLFGKMTQREIARKYNVSPSTISYIKNIGWKDLGVEK